MKKLEKKQIKVYRTDENGTIICTSNGKDLSFNVKTGDYKSGKTSKTNDVDK